MSRDDQLLTPPTKERLAKPDLGVVIGERGGREARSFAHPLDFYLRRDLITYPQRDAGTRYGELWEIGYHRSQFAQSKYGDPLNRGKYDPHYADECRDEYDRASLVLRDVKTRMMVFNVCCMGRMAGRGNVKDLASALNALDKHFYRYSKTR